MQGISSPRRVFPHCWGFSPQSGVFPCRLQCLRWLLAEPGDAGWVSGFFQGSAELPLSPRRAPRRSCTPPAPPSRRCGGARASRCLTTSTPLSSRYGPAEGVRGRPPGLSHPRARTWLLRAPVPSFGSSSQAKRGCGVGGCGTWGGGCSAPLGSGLPPEHGWVWGDAHRSL